LFGAGEAGAWPNVARALSRWFPSRERGTAQGIFFMGAHLGGGLTPALVALLVKRLHWRAVFVLFGLFGFAWAVVWRIRFRDDPAEHRAVSPAELAHIRAGATPTLADHPSGWRMLANPSVLAICAAYFTQGYGFYITWLPTYLLGGITTDRLTKRYGFRVGRCGVAGASLASAAMNTAGQIGGTLSPIVFAWITIRWSSAYALGLIALLYLRRCVLASG